MVLGARLPQWTIVSLPTLWFLLAYVGTTVLAAAWYAFAPNGPSLMRGIGVTAPSAVVADIGSPTYLALLFLPLLLVPFAAAITVVGTRRVFVAASRGGWLPSAPIHRSVLLLLFALSFGYCAFRLYQLDALNLTDVVACEDLRPKLLRRMALLDNLGFGYFMFAYGMNMILPIVAYLAYAMQGRRKADLATFAVGVVGMVFFIVETHSKAPILVFVVMIASVALMIRAPILHLVMVGSACIGAFLLAAVLLYGSDKCVGEPSSRPTVESHNSDAASSVLEHRYEARTTPAHFLEKLVGRSMIQRMAVGFPFYVHTYKDSQERCGIQGSTLRHLLGLSPPRCIMATRIYKEMWLDWIDGNQPAPAHVSAYGELGLPWAVAVMILSGITLGLLGRLIASGEGPLFAATCAASCGFAYYLTQVPFIGSFTYPHGLFAFMIPIAVLLVAHLLWRQNLNAPPRSSSEALKR